jgi:hypothetical protein
MDGGQLTFDDIERINSLASQPGRTAFIGECGNFGFDFEAHGTSSHYIICAVIVKNEDVHKMEQQVEEIRKSNFGTGDISSSLIDGNHAKRGKVLSELLQMNFSLIILIADKHRFVQDSPLSNYKSSFVKFLHQKLYESMYSVYPKLKIVEETDGASEFQEGYRKYIEEHRPSFDLLDEYDFDYTDSWKSNIIQMAGFIAGSVLQHIIDPASRDVLRMFQGSLRDVITFPRQPAAFTSGTHAESSFDDQIYFLADQRAAHFIETHKDSEEDEVRLRILFLRHLLFVARNINKTTFIHSSEITRHLSESSMKRVSQNYLYRKIIAPLRDADVLIASSAHGYKIPTSVKDIYTYINQTSGIVNPMLNRIEKCRKLISKQTDGALDILNDPALTKYKRYFGDY